MDVSRQVRQIYEERPYPDTKRNLVERPRWRLAPMKWIQALWQPSQPNPKRILVAGCGTGNEAFAFARRFPEAKIVAVDFCSRSIALAADCQKRATGSRNIRFVVGDLTNPQLAKIVGRHFDFISCHGVLSYIPKPERVLRILGGCLAPDGALYLGVNGAAHHSGGWGKVLPDFGFEMADFQDGRGLRSILKLFDALAGHSTGTIARKTPEYLASDLFCPLIHNWPLADWTRHCREAGLHFLGNYSMHRTLHMALNDDVFHLLMPRSRAAVAELADVLNPATFHRAIFAARPPADPPWEDRDRLLGCYPVLTDVYRHQWPKRRRSWADLRSLEIRSTEMNAIVELHVPHWEVEILRQSNGRKSLREILAEIPQRVTFQSLREQLYQLHHLWVLNFEEGGQPAR